VTADASPSAAHDDRLDDIAAGLGEAGLTVHLDQTADGQHVTATWSPPGRKEIEVIVDEDLYIELRWWADPAATPPGLVRAITAAARAAAAPAVDLGGAQP
jgi:hypothetical protein